MRLHVRTADGLVHLDANPEATVGFLIRRVMEAKKLSGDPEHHSLFNRVDNVEYDPSALLAEAEVTPGTRLLLLDFGMRTPTPGPD